MEIGEILDETIGEARADVPPHSIRATIDAFFEYIEREPQLYRFIVDSDAKRGSNWRQGRSPSTSPSASPRRWLTASSSAHDPRRRRSGGGRSSAWCRTLRRGGSAAPVSRREAVDTLTDLAWVGIVGSATGEGPSARRRATA